MFCVSIQFNSHVPFVIYKKITYVVSIAAEMFTGVNKTVRTEEKWLLLTHCNILTAVKRQAISVASATLKFMEYEKKKPKRFTYWTTDALYLHGIIVIIF
jgi:hypothetical protein